MLESDCIRLEDSFWAPRLHQLAFTQLPAQYRRCEETGRIDNFRRAAGRMGGSFQGRCYNDSDVYKWVEAASYAQLLDHPPELEGMLAALVELIPAAQQPDGYLNTYFTGEREEQRWQNLRDMHEMYCAGHLIQAAIAHRRCTGDSPLFDTAIRLADHVCRRFGPDGAPGAPGHQEIELALVELFRETGEQRYLRQARRFIDLRGGSPPLIGGSVYHQDHAPFTQLQGPAGHAVRMLYYACGAADLAMEGLGEDLMKPLLRIWRRMVDRRMYVTGGLGSRWEGESFGDDWELPNERAYAETCAGVAGVMWAQRMLMMTGEVEYADALERFLFNAVLPGLGLDGESFFYQNPLADDGGHRRTPWFECACCPPNLGRMMAQIRGYLALQRGRKAMLHQYLAGSYQFDGLRVLVRGDYPHSGDLQLTLQPLSADPPELLLRIPGWAEGARLDGVSQRANSWISVRAAPGTLRQVRLQIPCTARRIRCHRYVSGNHGRVALARGPLMYCFEAVDHSGVHPRDLRLPGEAQIEEAEIDIAGHRFVALRAAGARTCPAPDEALYHEDRPAEQELRTELTAAPYLAWANREPGGMAVWIREAGAEPPVA